MQRYTIFFIIVDAVHVSGGFSAHHQESKNCTHSTWNVLGLLLLPLAWLGWNWLLLYKPAGRGFDSQWCHWNISLT
jgi:hypothetical protein